MMNLAQGVDIQPRGEVEIQPEQSKCVLSQDMLSQQHWWLHRSSEDKSLAGFKVNAFNFFIYMEIRSVKGYSSTFSPCTPPKKKPSK